MDFWKKLKDEKLLLSVMTMAIVDLLILAVFIVFPIMDYNFKSEKTADSTMENLSSNTESEVGKEDDSASTSEKSDLYDGPISDKYYSQGVEGYNANKGNGGETAKDTTTPVSTEDEEDSSADDNQKDTEDTEDTISTEEQDNDSSEQSTDGSISDTTEENQGTEGVTSEEKGSEETPIVSTETPEQPDVTTPEQ